MPHRGGRAARYLIEAVRKGCHALGIDIRRFRADAPARIDEADVFAALLELRDRVSSGALLADEYRFLEFCARNAFRSRAQLMQDLFVLYHHEQKLNGYFVDFGATDGITINNTALLEAEHGWTGIVAEPARFWHERLRANRTCAINTDCLWRASGETLVFNETPDREYSTIDCLSAADWHAAARRAGRRYEVQTVSLSDLLAQNGAPPAIDYLSADTEGSEFEILNAFDFSRYDIRVITVEHNFTPNRERIHELLTRNGYMRKFEAFSRWDDWYVRQ